MYTTIRSQVPLIMGPIEPDQLDLFALELRNISVFDFFYTVASTDINQSALNLVKMYVAIRFWMSSSMDLIVPEWSELFALEFEKLPYLTLFTL